MKIGYNPHPLYVHLHFPNNFLTFQLVSIWNFHLKWIYDTRLQPNLGDNIRVDKVVVDPLSTKRVTSNFPTHAITLIDAGLGTLEMAFKDNSASSSDSLDSAPSYSNSSLDVSSCASSSTSLLSSSSNTYACPVLHLCSLLHLSPHLKQRPFFILSWTSSLDIFFTSYDFGFDALASPSLSFQGILVCKGFETLLPISLE
ncbi:hypothetical protein I3843_11G143700 [Carya illinoinensis]|nr:hypothetical protein I3843_11G143700 [Carya illinoinensis]